MKPPSAQNVVGPDAITTTLGAAKNAVVTLVLSEPPQFVTVSVTVVSVVTLIDWVVSPVDHRYVAFGSAPAVNIMISPLQNAALPDMEAVGGEGSDMVVDAMSLPAQLVTVTLYVPTLVTEIDVVVAPVDQT